MLRLFERRTPAAPVAHIEVAHAGEVFRVALKRLSTSQRFTLRVRAATRDVLLTMPSRSSLRSAREFAERHAAWIGARLARLPRPVAFAPSRGDAVSRRQSHHRPSSRRARRRVDGSGRARAADLRERREAAYRAPRRRFPQARGAQGHRGGGRASRQADRRRAAPHHLARHREPLGLVLFDGRD